MGTGNHFVLWRVALTAIGVFVTTLPAPPAVAQGVLGAACRNARAESYLDAARSEQESHDWRTARRDAALAAPEFDRCARVERGAEYANSLYREAAARIIVGLAILDAGGPRDNADVRQAYALYRWVAQSDQADAMQRRLAARKAKATLAVARTLPLTLSFAQIPRPALSPRRYASAAQTQPRDRVVSESGAPTATEAPTATPILAALSLQVVDDWQTRYNGPRMLEHVRVHLIANRDILLMASLFRISVTSPSGGLETAYGYNGVAPSYERTNWFAGNSGQAMTSMPTVDPNEDLGRQAVQLHTGDAITKVITFVLRSDAQFAKDDPTAIRWIGPKQ